MRSTHIGALAGQSALVTHGAKHTPLIPLNTQLPDAHTALLAHAAPPASPLLVERHKKSTRSAPSLVVGEHASPAAQSVGREQLLRHAPNESTELRAAPPSGITPSDDDPLPHTPPGSIAAHAMSPAAPGVQSETHRPPKQNALSHCALDVHTAPSARVPALAMQRLQRRSPHW